MPLIPIDTLDDSRLDDYRNVSDRELLQRRGLFVAEGRLVVERLLMDRVFAVRSVLVTDTVRAALSRVLAARPEVDVYVVSAGVIRAITGFNIHRGCLAIGERRELRPWTELALGARCLVVLERVGNADNMGSIFRNALAFGVQGVLLGPACVDPLYRKAIRTSMGGSLRVPYATAEPWPLVLSALRASGFTVVAMSPSAPDTVEAVARSLSPAASVAVVVGHEGDGLSPAASAACRCHARIPVLADADSLNVSTATALALYELGRALHRG